MALQGQADDQHLLQIVEQCKRWCSPSDLGTVVAWSQLVQRMQILLQLENQYLQ